MMLLCKPPPHENIFYPALPYDFESSKSILHFLGVLKRLTETACIYITKYTEIKCNKAGKKPT